MNTNEDFTTGSPIDRATARTADAAKAGIDAASDHADRLLDTASTTLRHVRDETAPALKQGIDQARGWVDAKTARARDGIRAGRDKASELSDQVVDYTRDEPFKALLIAAAVGAGLMGLLALIARSDD